MPSSPKIPKEMILKKALDLLIDEGYAALNIKALAKELGSSTQPISWHFGNMEGLRTALAAYALEYANERMRPSAENAIEAFAEVGASYINIAFDMPNLFRFLYLDGYSGDTGNIDSLIADKDNADLIDRLTAYLSIPKEKATSYLRNTIIYTHGIASFIALNVIGSTKEQVMDMVNNAGNAFLLQAGTDLSKVPSDKTVRTGGGGQ